MVIILTLFLSDLLLKENSLLCYVYKNLYAQTLLNFKIHFNCMPFNYIN